MLMKYDMTTEDNSVYRPREPLLTSYNTFVQSAHVDATLFLSMIQEMLSKSSAERGVRSTKWLKPVSEATQMESVQIYFRYHYERDTHLTATRACISPLHHSRRTEDAHQSADRPVPQSRYRGFVSDLDPCSLRMRALLDSRTWHLRNPDSRSD